MLLTKRENTIMSPQLDFAEIVGEQNNLTFFTEPFCAGTTASISLYLPGVNLPASLLLVDGCGHTKWTAYLNLTDIGSNCN